MGERIEINGALDHIDQDMNQRAAEAEAQAQQEQYDRDHAEAHAIKEQREAVVQNWALPEVGEVKDKAGNINPEPRKVADQAESRDVIARSQKRLGKYEKQNPSEVQSEDGTTTWKGAGVYETTSTLQDIIAANTASNPVRYNNSLELQRSKNLQEHAGKNIVELNEAVKDAQMHGQETLAADLEAIVKNRVQADLDKKAAQEKLDTSKVDPRYLEMMDRLSGKTKSSKSNEAQSETKGADAPKDESAKTETTSGDSEKGESKKDATAETDDVKDTESKEDAPKTDNDAEEVIEPEIVDDKGTTKGDTVDAEVVDDETTDTDAEADQPADTETDDAETEPTDESDEADDTETEDGDDAEEEPATTTTPESAAKTEPTTRREKRLAKLLKRYEKLSKGSPKQIDGNMGKLAAEIDYLRYKTGDRGDKIAAESSIYLNRENSLHGLGGNKVMLRALLESRGITLPATEVRTPAPAPAETPVTADEEAEQERTDSKRAKAAASAKKALSRLRNRNAKNSTEDAEGDADAGEDATDNQPEQESRRTALKRRLAKRAGMILVSNREKAAAERQAAAEQEEAPETPEPETAPEEPDTETQPAEPETPEQQQQSRRQRLARGLGRAAGSARVRTSNLRTRVRANNERRQRRLGNRDLDELFEEPAEDEEREKVNA